MKELKATVAPSVYELTMSNVNLKPWSLSSVPSNPNLFFFRNFTDLEILRDIIHTLSFPFTFPCLLHLQASQSIILPCCSICNTSPVPPSITPLREPQSSGNSQSIVPTMTYVASKARVYFADMPSPKQKSNK